ncbi:MAG: helix-turn-helix transcriptional regulator [Alphaproteobacteria bacterium]|nr:helix-turn-helix transcriptional regulator [Alphaproteobacteria bacterium]NCQ88992.1 helix-turn-helix transcriptional regulator [Alphaproteobacteria bacterium]NCT07893.1 helix-turn-helix transcriptional regulator [Alphaproteobacteria bacterium]
MNTRYEEEFNKALGFRLMTLRQSHKMSQEYLGAKLGVRYQQIQKYETGATRMPPERIATCARLFSVPVEYFFGSEQSEVHSGYSKAVLTVAAEIMALPNDDVRKSVYHLARTINKSWDIQDNEEVKIKNKVSR